MHANLVYKIVLGTAFCIGIPLCDTPDKREKGKVGKEHLVYVKDRRFEKEGHFYIMTPYHEKYIDDEDGSKEKDWVSWQSAESSYLLLPIDDEQVLFFCLLSEVSAELLEFLHMQE